MTKIIRKFYFWYFINAIYDRKTQFHALFYLWIKGHLKFIIKIRFLWTLFCFCCYFATLFLHFIYNPLLV